MFLINFRITFSFIDSEFSQTLEYLEASSDYSQKFEPFLLWREMFEDQFAYHLSNSKSSYLKELVLKYVQRFFTFNFFGHGDTAGTITKVEFYFIWCMPHAIKVNIGSWPASQFHYIIIKKWPFILGSYITLLVINLGLFYVEDND